MSNYSTLKTAIQQAVYTNGNNEITGAGLQSVLLQIVDTIGDGYVFKGVATAGTTPGTPDQNVFYIGGAGTYTNFGGSYTVPLGSIGVFSWNGNWQKASVDTGIKNALFSVASPFSRVSITKSGTDLAVTFKGTINLMSQAGQVYGIAAGGPWTVPNYYSLVYDFSDSSVKVVTGINMSNNYVHLLMNEGGSIVGGLFAAPYLNAKIAVEKTDVLNSLLQSTYKIISPPVRCTINTSGTDITVAFSGNMTIYSDAGGTQSLSLSGQNYTIPNYYSLIYDFADSTVKVAALLNLNDRRAVLIHNEGGSVTGGLLAGYWLSKKIDGVSEEVKDLYTDGADRNFLPVKTAQITTSFTAGRFTTRPIFEYFLNGGVSLFIDYFIYKPTSGRTTMNLSWFNVPASKGATPVLSSEETITLDSSWLDSTYGTGVYKVPYFKNVTKIPAVGYFYYVNGIDSIGFCDMTRSYNGQNASSMQGEIYFGCLAHIPASGIIAPYIRSPWYGKKVCFLGDSITAHGFYIDGFSKATGADCINAGVSGTTMVMSDDGSANTFEQRLAALSDDVDALVIAGGVNDFRVDTCLFGQLSDGAQAGLYTFYAGLHRLFSAAANKYFGKPVAVMTPMHNLDNPQWGAINYPEFTVASSGAITFRTNPASGKTLAEYVEAIKEVSAFYSMPVIDAYAESGMCPSLTSQQGTWYNTGDLLHPNLDGGLKIGRFLAERMNSIYKYYYETEH